MPDAVLGDGVAAPHEAAAAGDSHPGEPGAASLHAAQSLGNGNI